MFLVKTFGRRTNIYQDNELVTLATYRGIRYFIDRIKVDG